MKRVFFVSFCLFFVFLCASCAISINQVTSFESYENNTVYSFETVDIEVTSILDESETTENTVETTTHFKWKPKRDVKISLEDHQPTDEEIYLIQVGMKFSEVCEILGRPNSYVPYINSIDYCWVTIEGNTYRMKFEPFEAVDKRTIDSELEYYMHTKVTHGPDRIRTCFRSYASSDVVSCTIDGIDYYQIEKHTSYYLTVPSTIPDGNCRVYRIEDGKPIDVSDEIYDIYGPLIVG